MWQQVILVDEQDNPIGTEEKMKAHIEGKLHRAFSIFLFNAAGELLLQQRAAGKYHSTGLWTNTCCSHPQPEGELLLDARARLMEEMGIECELRKEFEFTYRAQFDNGLTEYEYDHVLFGDYNEEPRPNPEEVSHFRWASLDEISSAIKEHPQHYSVWFRECFPAVMQHCQSE